VTGDTAVVGAVGDDCTTGGDCGSTYVFRFIGTSWVEEQKLTASDAARGDAFGSSVAVTGDMAVVGANRDDCTAGDHCGAAYVFRFNGVDWIEEQKLTASDAGARDYFGNVSVSGDTAVVGAQGADCAAGDWCGAAYVFRFNGTSWIENQKLTAPNTTGRELFGFSVSAKGNTAVVGAPKHACAAGMGCGSAHVFSCTFVATVANLDIKPGSCPNPVNPGSRGVVPVAIVGSPVFDVTMVTPDSLTLARADGLGGRVSPVSGRQGPKIAIDDVATPCAGEPCACHELEGDGIADLSLKFSTPDLTRVLELDALPRGTTVELVLRGALEDGTTFEAVDCIMILGRHRVPRVLRRTSRSR
jgi:hypothetical protein